MIPKISESATKIRAIIDEAISNGKISRKDYDNINHIASEDSMLDNQERVLIAHLNTLIYDRDVVFIKE